MSAQPEDVGKIRYTDEELIAYMRRHQWGIKERWFALCDLMAQTGIERQGAYERMCLLLDHLRSMQEQGRDTDVATSTLALGVASYREVHDRTGELRANAFDAMQNAMIQTFAQALYTSPDADPELREHWLQAAEQEFGLPGMTTTDPDDVVPIVEVAIVGGIAPMLDMDPIGAANVEAQKRIHKTGSV